MNLGLERVGLPSLRLEVGLDVFSIPEVVRNHRVDVLKLERRKVLDDLLWSLAVIKRRDDRIQ